MDGTEERPEITDVEMKDEETKEDGVKDVETSSESPADVTESTNSKRSEIKDDEMKGGETNDEEIKDNGMKDGETSSESTTDVTESTNSKRIDKRKQRYPTKQSTDAPKTFAGEKKPTNKDNTEKMNKQAGDDEERSTCVIQMSKKGDCSVNDNNDSKSSKDSLTNKSTKGEIRKTSKTGPDGTSKSGTEKDIAGKGEAMDESENSKNTGKGAEDVSPRRSSRAPKKKKMFGFDDSDEEHVTPKKRRNSDFQIRPFKDVKPKTRKNKSKKGKKKQNVPIPKVNQFDVLVTEDQDDIVKQEIDQASPTENNVEEKTMESKNKRLMKEKSTEQKEGKKGKKDGNMKAIKQEPVEGEKQVYSSKKNVITKPKGGKSQKKKKDGPLLSMKEEIRVINASKNKSSESKKTNKPVNKVKEKDLDASTQPDLIEGEKGLSGEASKDTEKKGTDENENQSTDMAKTDGTEEHIDTTNYTAKDKDKTEGTEKDMDDYKGTYENMDKEAEKQSGDDKMEADDGTMYLEVNEVSLTDAEGSDKDVDAEDYSDAEYVMEEEEGTSDDDMENDNDDGTQNVNKTDREKENKKISENVPPNLTKTPKPLKEKKKRVHNDSLDYSYDENGTPIKLEKVKEKHKLLVEKYKCDQCDMGLASRGQFMRHVADAHDGILPFPCTYPLCTRRFSNTSNLKKHISAVHLNIRKHNCNYCPKVFKNSSALRVHLYSKHEEHCEKRPKFECDVCHKIFRQRLQLRVHQTVHSAERPYTCIFEGCGRTFRLKSNKLKHERVHENIKPYKCDKCEMSFSRKVYLETHQYKHTGVKKFQCRLCNKMFSQKGNLDIHMKLHCEDREFYNCERCMKPYSNKSNLTKHMQTTCSLRKPALKMENTETLFIQQSGDRSTTDIASIIQEVKDITSSDTVFIIQEENADNIVGKIDKSCGTEELRARLLSKPAPNNQIQNKRVVTTDSNQIQTLGVENVDLVQIVEDTNINPQVSIAGVPITQGGSDTQAQTQTIYIENPVTANGIVPVQEEIVQNVANTEEVSYAELENVHNAQSINSLTDIINPSASSSGENVEYEIVSSGLDGVEEGILKEFLSKWNQQSTPPGTTVILDVQNRDNTLGLEGTNQPNSVQYIVTVKDQD